MSTNTSFCKLTYQAANPDQSNASAILDSACGQHIENHWWHDQKVKIENHQNSSTYKQTVLKIAWFSLHNLIGWKLASFIFMMTSVCNSSHQHISMNQYQVRMLMVHSACWFSLGIIHVIDGKSQHSVLQDAVVLLLNHDSRFWPGVFNVLRPGV